MATVHIAFHDAAQFGGSSIPTSAPRASESITSSGSSQASTATAKQGEIARVASSGGAVYIVSGSASPTAASTSGYMIPDGGVEFIGPLNEGDKVALIDI